MRRFFILLFCSYVSFVGLSAFANCNPVPTIQGKFEILDIKPAKLKCLVTPRLKAILFPHYIAGTGCYLTVKILPTKHQKKKHSEPLEVYGNGETCQLKKGKILNVKMVHPCCDQGQTLITCQLKPELKLVSFGNPNSYKDMVCMSGKWIILNDNAKND